MPSKFTRRDFLKLGAMTATAAVVSGCTIDLQRTEYLESYVHPPEEGLPGENLYFASTCRQCAAGCGIVVRVSEGRARKIEGNPQHPINQGKLCARGQAALQELYDPDRLRNAVRQKGGRGSSDFEPIRWEEALDALVERLRSARPGTAAFLGGNPPSHMAFVIQRFMEALGGRPPLFYTLGDELEGRSALVQHSSALFEHAALPFFDIGEAEAVFSFGASFLETWISPVGYSRAYAQMRRGPLGKRGYLVQFEPRCSSTAASADQWVPLRPGTEGLVALALGKIIVKEGQVRDERYAGFFEGIDVAEVAAACDIPAERLEHMARILAGVERPLAIPGGALAGQGFGSEAMTAVQALNLLLGRVGQPGGVFFPETSPLAESETAFLPPANANFEQLHRLAEASKAGDIQLLLIHGCDPLFELPGGMDFAQVLASVPTVISFSSTINETAVQADMVLPDHTNLESWGYHVPALADRFVVSGLQPVTRPLYDTRATVDVFLALAQMLGGAVSTALPWPNEVECLQESLEAWRGQDISAEAFWADWRRRGGRWSEQRSLQAPTPPAALEEPRRLRAAAISGETAYPLQLHLYPSVTLFDGRGANKSWLQETPDPMTTVAWQTWVEIHPHTAEELALHDGDVVRVISPAGEVEGLVYITPGIHKEVVAMPIGRGHQHYGRFAKGNGSNPLDLLFPASGEDSTALSWATTRVRLEKTGRRKELARLEDPEGIAYLQGGEH